MCWWLILEDFGPNIQHIAGVDNIVYDKLSRLTSPSVHKYKTIISKAQSLANELFTIGREEKSEDAFPLNIFNVQIEQHKEPRKLSYKLST